MKRWLVSRLNTGLELQCDVINLNHGPPFHCSGLVTIAIKSIKVHDDSDGSMSGH